MLVFGTVIAAHALRYYAVGKCMARHRSQYQGSHTASASASPNAHAHSSRRLDPGTAPILPGATRAPSEAASLVRPNLRPGVRHRWSSSIGYVTICFGWLGSWSRLWDSRDIVDRRDGRRLDFGRTGKARVASATHAIQLRDVLRNRRPSPADSDRLSARLGYDSYSGMSPILAFTSWIPTS